MSKSTDLGGQVGNNLKNSYRKLRRAVVNLGVGTAYLFATAVVPMLQVSFAYAEGDLDGDNIYLDADASLSESDSSAEPADAEENVDSLSLSLNSPLDSNSFGENPGAGELITETTPAFSAQTVISDADAAETAETQESEQEDNSNEVSSADSCDSVDFANDSSWTALALSDGATSITLSDAGNYYLSADLTDLINGTPSTATSLITVKADVNLCLNGHTLSRQSTTTSSRVIEVTSGTLTIGDGGDSTGKILIDRANSTSTNSGYGIYLAPTTSAELILNAGEITAAVKEETAPKLTGIYAGKNAVITVNSGKISGFTYSGIYLAQSTFTMNGGEISGNSNPGSGTAKYGGGIHSEKNSGITINGGEISGNSSTGYGGGIYVDGTSDPSDAGGSSLTIAGGEVASNTTTKNGGGIYGQNAKVTITGGTISENFANIYGGGIAISGCELAISGGEISENGKSGSETTDTETGETTTTYTYTQSGGGIYAEAYSSASKNSEITISGGKISENSADNGGGIHSEKNSDITINGGEISGNTANLAGGGIYAYNSETEISGGEISKNASNGTDEYNEVYGGGGALIYNGTLSISGGKISENTSAQSGGGIKIKGTAQAEITGGTFSKNIATISGGALALFGTTVVKISGGTFTENQATDTYYFGKGDSTITYSGGAIYVDSASTLYLTNVAVYNNTATSTYTLEDVTYDTGLGGGGLAACPTANVKIYVNDGGIFYQNQDNGDRNTNEIFIATNSKNYNAFVSEYHLGGGAYNWTDPDGNSVDAGVAGSGGQTVRINNSLTATDVLVQKAMAKAQVLIYNNTGLIGGGIATNGSLIIGTDDDTQEIPVHKYWQDDSENQRPASIQVKLLLAETADDGTITYIDTGKLTTLTAQDGWFYLFTDLPAAYTYAVTEIPVDGYDGEIYGLMTENGYEFVIVNSKVAEEPEDEPKDATPEPQDTTPLSPSITTPDTGTLTVTKTAGAKADSGSLWFVPAVTLLTLGGMLLIFRRKSVLTNAI